MNNSLQKMIEHENNHWNKIFEAELVKNNDKKFSSPWWENYYKELTYYLNQVLIKNNLKTVLEAGSGSGKATLLLDKNFDKTLLDISHVALKYAKYIANKFDTNNVKYCEADIFAIPFEKNRFGLVWNIGVIEHYELKDIKLIIHEMVRVCSKSGIVAVGIPNFYSGPIIKAWLLKKLKIIPGYKLDTEKFYETDEIKAVFQEVSEKTGRKIQYFDIQYFGNPLIMESPALVLNTIGKFISLLFKKNRFLMLIACKFQ